MSVYPHLDQIQDPAARTAVKLLYDRVAALEATAAASQGLGSPTAAVAGAQQQVINLADPQGPTDAVNVRTLRIQIQSAFQQALRTLGVSGQPISVQGR